MSIVSSTYRTWAANATHVHVEERHTDSQGRIHFLGYTAPNGYDHDAKLAANAAMLADMLAEQEANEVLA
jgi:hypothetical protein